MASPIEDYALLSDLHTGALVSLHGSVDWLCFPRFDSGAQFTALLGDPTHGRWLLAPAGAPDNGSSAAGVDANDEDTPVVVERSYLNSTFVLRTLWQTSTGHALVTDFMPIGAHRASLIRRVEGLAGSVRMHQEISFRLDYGDVVPWVRRHGIASRGGKSIVAVGGPDALVLHGDRLPRANGLQHEGDFLISAGEVVDFELSWYPSHRQVPDRIDVGAALQDTASYWRSWARDVPEHHDYGQMVQRSLLVLRALTHETTGGIVAAPTTSLPESFGGERNWDYRFCWLRDAALTLEAMMTHSYQQEAVQWRNWLLRAIAGNPEDLQIMYGLSGERRLPERELTHLPGYEGAVPVREGNGAVDQYQGDVVGEVMVALEKLRNMGGLEDHFSWPLQKALLSYVELNYDRTDHGIWEMRGEKKHFTHSRVMMWAAFDRGVRAVREHGLDGDAELWEKRRDDLAAEIMKQGFNREINSFTQTYGGTEVDASLLVLPQVGFTAYDSPEMLGTVERLERDLVDEEGLILRYRTDSGLDGLPPGEHPFLACCFWLVEQYARTDRLEEARALMDKLIGYANPLGLMAEEYDTGNRRMAGNFPQAFSHLGLIRAADAINAAAGA
ncbi:glycoside hydrolase family 15 protein [Zhihengliuella flava]|uniref:GH15 family glucan-1,4-alpha-glucosidase n=1 Tax=Zhihengliuella flava TaxID=1285193 RepID=A0A931D9A4_9MICC|nr:glycoside hydrolase family 15 protein [Zhihengliuella flava]MBG6084357.1 GH15 family glucan-1,4-alpha-glucosidase [Zhihengliuella flava]